MMGKFYFWLGVVILVIINNLPSPAPARSQTPFDKYALWTNGTQLRGANIWQRKVYPELDGLEFLGDEAYGPPYSQEDFNRLAELGANYVNLSIAGLFSITPPYELDPAAQAALDDLLAKAAQADLFAVISFRTGPGRSDFTFVADGAGVWFDPSYLIESVWEDQVAQDAWVAMWRHTAERYRDNPIVAGYDLMVEPNSAGDMLGIYDPAEFDARYARTLYDWNQLAPRLVAAIRQVDSQTPILVGGNSWSAVTWMEHIRLIDDPRIVYTAHQYEPFVYTHQEPDDLSRTYPGDFDLDYDGDTETFDAVWLQTYLWGNAGAFRERHGVPIAINEFGIKRWVPDAAQFMDDQMELFEVMGINYALWAFNPAWEPHQHNDAFDFLHGSDPANQSYAPEALAEVIQKYWANNTLRPSMIASP